MQRLNSTFHPPGHSESALLGPRTPKPHQRLLILPSPSVKYQEVGGMAPQQHRNDQNPLHGEWGE